MIVLFPPPDEKVLLGKWPLPHRAGRPA